MYLKTDNLLFRMDQLSHIRKPIEEELRRYQALYEMDFTHTNPLLQMALQHIRKRQGKRLRPIVAMLAARCFGHVNEAVLHAAVGLELVHTASLVHDDIVDESDMRRGQASVNTLLSNQAAVLVGDYILARSLYHGSKTRCLEVVNILSAATEQLSDGELLQMYTLDSDRVEEEVYYDIIRRKTAVLFGTSAQVGALLAGAGEEGQEALRLYGEYLGIAFQIRDDMLDYEGGDALGKPTGNDMKEGKLTLPVIYAVNKGDLPEMRELALKVRRGEALPQDIHVLVEFTLEQGGLQYAAQEMERYAAMAIQQLASLPDSEFTASLCGLARLAVQRNH